MNEHYVDQSPCALYIHPLVVCPPPLSRSLARSPPLPPFHRPFVEVVTTLSMERKPLRSSGNRDIHCSESVFKARRTFFRPPTRCGSSCLRWTRPCRGCACSSHVESKCWYLHTAQFCKTGRYGLEHAEPHIDYPWCMISTSTVPQQHLVQR